MQTRVKSRVTPVNLAIVTMFLLGAISLVASISYDSSIPAFIGLGLVFWAAVLFYIKPEEHTSKIFLEAALSPSLTTLDQMIEELGYKGDATYLPPKYFTNPETTKIYISKRKDTSLPTPEQTQPIEDQPVTKTAQGLLITPPGIQLSKMMEKSLGTNFIKTDLDSLQQNLPKIFIENLEIAENLDLQTSTGSVSINQKKNTTIHAEITKPIYGNIFKEAENPAHSSVLIGCPIRSAIAVALTKATGKPVKIVDNKNSEDGNSIEATYEILEE